MRYFILVVISFVFISCGSTDSQDDNIPPVTQGDWYQPALDTSWQWQLSGALNTTYDVDMYDIDLFDSSVSLIQSLQDDGKKVICYFSAGSYEEWREDAGDFPSEVIGNDLDGWDGERWLDISSEELQSIMLARLDLAKSKGCDGVEPDNMGNYANNTGFNLTANDQLKYNKFIANAAHERELSVALKNALNQIEELEPYFDFSVNEQCHQYNECEMMQVFIDAGKPVFNAEYDEKYLNNVEQRTQMCNESLTLKLKTLVLAIELDDSIRFSCD